jgi:hypothetical protein
MDGSEVYGAGRHDGWLEVMKRYVCELGPEVSNGGDGSSLILDLIQTKDNRTELYLFGSQYGGPDFSEPSPASRRLTVDEYFYVDTDADIQVDENGTATEVLPFNRDSKRWCSHVDVEHLDSGNNETSTIALKPVCGIGGYRKADGMGIISGISLAASSSGSFEYDGLVTTVDRWMKPNSFQKRRFRFVSSQSVGTEGDVRAFVLSPSLSSSRFQTFPVTLENCSMEYCVGDLPMDRPIECSCLRICTGNVLKRVIILQGDLSDVEIVGDC